MNSEANLSWPSMVHTSDDEFANFLNLPDLPELDIDFSNFDSEADANAVAGRAIHDAQPSLYDRCGRSGYYAGDAGMRDDTMILEPASATDINMLKGGISGLQVQSGNNTQVVRHVHAGQQPTQFHGQGRIPPTPTSLDINANRSHFAPVDPQQQAMYDAHFRKQQQEMVFTPLGTPAVTPLDRQYQMPEYTTPGAYFSPLASPALIPQSTTSAERSAYPRFHASDHSETTSPIDMNFDQALKVAATSAPASKRQKKRSPSGSSRPAARSVRESPAMKPQRKKQSTSTVISAKDAAEVIASASRPKTSGGSQRTRDSLWLPASRHNSESDSISPEPLSDLMPPPATPRPGSAAKSPYMTGQMEVQSASGHAASASATPRSLVEIQKPSNRPRPGLKGDTEMQDISLGEAAMDTATFLPKIDTLVTDVQPAPTIMGQGGHISASTTGPAPIPPSPTASSAPTPKTLGSRAKNDFKVPAKGKKRTSSSHASPALRPRISPSIKPLLPEGTSMNAETSALLLASKSNYQNLIEGTHLPGVTYPEALSENLTSKRTSHKIAEQGRRNRINTALQEIASLLPHGRDLETDGSATPSMAAGNSKATTVEAAIDYIKTLQMELRVTKGKLADAEGKLEDMQGSNGVEREMEG